MAARRDGVRRLPERGAARREPTAQRRRSRTRTPRTRSATGCGSPTTATTTAPSASTRTRTTARCAATQDIKVQIVEGRKTGAERLILSGGEPTMHPNFLDFVKLGKRAGYRKVQTVTNGRMFTYPEFLETRRGRTGSTRSRSRCTATRPSSTTRSSARRARSSRRRRASRPRSRRSASSSTSTSSSTSRTCEHLPEMLETFIGWGVQGVRSAAHHPVRQRVERGARPPLLRSRREPRVPAAGVRVRAPARRAHLAEPLSAAVHRGFRGSHPGSVQAERRGARPARGVRPVPVARPEAHVPRAGALQVLLPAEPLRHARRGDRRAQGRARSTCFVIAGEPPRAGKLPEAGIARIVGREPRRGRGARARARRRPRSSSSSTSTPASKPLLGEDGTIFGKPLAALLHGRSGGDGRAPRDGAARSRCACS